MKKYIRKNSVRAVFGAIACTALLGLSATAMAATEIQLWHSLNEHNSRVFDQLVKKYNRQQSDNKVVVQDFLNEEALEQALAMVEKEKPHVVQLP